MTLSIDTDLVMLPSRQSTSKQIVLGHSLSYSSKRVGADMKEKTTKAEEKKEARLQSKREKRQNVIRAKQGKDCSSQSSGRSIGMKRTQTLNLPDKRAKKQNSTISTSEGYSGLDILAMDGDILDFRFSGAYSSPCVSPSSLASFLDSDCSAQTLSIVHRQRADFLDEGSSTDEASVSSPVTSKQHQPAGCIGGRSSHFIPPRSPYMEAIPSQHEYGSEKIFHGPSVAVSTPCPVRTCSRPVKPVSSRRRRPWSTVAVHTDLPYDSDDNNSSDDQQQYCKSLAYCGISVGMQSPSIHSTNEESQVSDDDFNSFVIGLLTDLE